MRIFKKYFVTEILKNYKVVRQLRYFCNFFFPVSAQFANSGSQFAVYYNVVIYNFVILEFNTIFGLNTVLFKNDYEI